MKWQRGHPSRDVDDRRGQSPGPRCGGGVGDDRIQRGDMAQCATFNLPDPS